MIRVWRNECTRVFCDRLINKRVRICVPIEAHFATRQKLLIDFVFFQDIRLANDFIEEIIEERFEQHADYALRNPLLFGDYRTAMDDDAARIYEDILDYAAAKALFQELLEDYNEVNNRMTLVLFDDALEHLTRVHRALRMHKGQ